ncbi:hypothetical protein N7466_008503 [Penicillium verhagenii]|uniref:uncharacterized protein n=1 Tax=Penicillium verhagenii TaxID=1562060 RepID=UPI00254597D4|nr:uncharacterized protein N7466_008503 [Penicillium verhagenii]KAJ5924316.1 hypothetical protein N7466_008503 [Penicillium verhagenii]
MKLTVLLSLLRLGAGLAIGAEVENSATHQWLPPTKHFELNLTWESRAPDGVAREQFLVNGQFPGPPLIMDEGDNVQVTVNNFSPFNTTIHYHGIEQKGTPWSDGVPGVSQRQILPGKQFVSKFTVQQYGSYWYHSHTAGQIMDGLYGPIYIRPRSIPKNLTISITNDTLQQAQIHKAIHSPELVLLSDWIHQTSDELREIAETADVDIFAVPASLFDECDATQSAEEVIEVNPSLGWASLNFIGGASISAPTVSINNHSLWVYEIDGLYINPIEVQALTINNGARYSALIQLNQTPGNYSITAANSGLNQKIAAFGTLSYKHGHAVNSTPYINYGAIDLSTDVVTLDETTIEMLIPSQPSQEPDATHILTVGRVQEAWKWSLNGNHTYDVAFEADKPYLWDPQSAAKSPLTITTKNNTWVDIVFSLTGSATVLQPGHPLHKHSNRVYVIVSASNKLVHEAAEHNLLIFNSKGSGSGDFNYTTVAEAAKAIPESFNLINPPMRDTFVTLPAFGAETWMAIRYQVLNPGAFLLHCHLDPHLTGGMGLVFLDGVDAWPSIPAQYGPDGQWPSVEEDC